MSLPSSSARIVDGALGVVPPSPGQTVVHVGVATAGPLNTLAEVSNTRALVDAYTSGPLVDAKALSLNIAGRKRQLVCRCAASVAGSNGSVTKTDPSGSVGVGQYFGGAVIVPAANVNGLLVAAKVSGVTFAVVVAGNGTSLTVPALAGGSKAIVVNSATDGGGAATSDANAVRAALVAEPTVAALIDAAALGTGAAVCGALAAYALDKGALTLTAKGPGTRAKVQVSGNSTALDATVAGSDLTIVDSTSAGGLPTGTASQVKTKIEAVAGAAALVNATLVGDGTGLLAAAAFTALQFGSTGSVSVSGAPLDRYQVRVRITRAGTLNVGAFIYSLDGGDNYTAELAIPLAGTYALPGTGLTLTFTPGSGPLYFDVGDTFSFDTVAPSANLSDLTAALAAIQADPREFSIVHIVGAATAAIAAAVASVASSFELAKKYCLFVLETADQGNSSNSAWSAGLITDFANVASIRVAVVAGYGEVFSPVTGRIQRRPIAWTMVARAGAVSISDDIGEVATGPLQGLSALYHEDQAATLDAQRFSTAYSLSGYPGFYGEGKLMSAPGSDFSLWQDIRVMSEVQRVANIALTRKLSGKARVKAHLMDPRDSSKLAAWIKSQVDAALTNQRHCSKVRIVIESPNFDTLRKATCKLYVTGLSYLKTLEAEVSFDPEG